MNLDKHSELQKPTDSLSRRQFLKLACTVGFSISASQFLAACAEPTPAPAGVTTTTATKTRVIVGLGGEPASLDRNYEENALGFNIYGAIYDFLVKAGPNGDILPSLATEWKQIDDLTLELKLREGVQFHNGEEFDAQAVHDTIMTGVLADPPGVIKTRLLPVDRVDIVDKYTLRVHSTSLFVTLLAALTTVAIYPSAYYKEVGQRGFAGAPVGTGAFRLKEWNRGVSITLEKFDDYWGAEPKIDEVVWQFYPETGSRLAALEAGEIDLAGLVPPDDIERLKAKGFETVWSPIGAGMTLQFVPRRAEQLNDKRVRQAFAYAINLDEIVNGLLLGWFKKLEGQCTGPDGFGYNPDLEAYPYDPEKAKQLLTEAGYPNGFSIKMHISEGRYIKQKELGELLAGQLSKVGINVELNPTEWTTMENKILISLDSDPLYYWAWNYFPAMDADFWMQHYMCDSPFETYCDPRFDELFAESRQELDREKRRKLLQELAALMREECPAVWLYQRSDIWMTNPRVKGLRPTAENVLYLDEAYVEP